MLTPFRQAVAADPDSAAAHFRLGVALHASGRIGPARRSLARAWRLDPALGLAQLMLGVIQQAAGNLSGAIRHYRRAVAADTACGAHLSLALALCGHGDEAGAARVVDDALALQPDHAELVACKGNILMKSDRHDEAVSCFRRSIALQPGVPHVHHSLGVALARQGRWDEAIQAYEQALLAPSRATPAIHNDMGKALERQGRLDEALAGYDRALEADPSLTDALINSASLLQKSGRFERALPAFERLVHSDKPDYMLGGLLGAKNHACDWSGRDALVSRVEAAVRAGERACFPFTWIAVTGSAQSQLDCTRIFADDKCPPAAKPIWRGERYSHERIRLAYLSADFQSHATAFLMAELFELHDQSRFETIALSFGPVRPGPMRDRLERAFSRFMHVDDRNAEQIARLMRELEVDIAVDLKGYTVDCRAAIFAHRAAPVQVSYLGYPATTAQAHIDYLIGDTQVLEPGDAPFYTEKLVRLPGSYQVNDRKRRIADATPARAQLQLPDGAFVFCCFNNSYKITPEVFDVWMRLLTRVPGSVLWLLEDNALAVRNLRREAGARGVDGERLVFAPRVPLEQHLARHRLADLFLDTLPCNAHTTASDALWAGLPVLTCRGSTFASRVAASLLHAAGLPELVTHSLPDYEALAFRLATTPALLDGLRVRLAANRLSCPLFDAGRTCRNLESAYTTMWQRAQAGLPAAHFDVAQD